MKNFFYLIVLLITGFVISSCNQNAFKSFDEEAEKAKILELLDINGKFLLTEDLDLFKNTICSEFDTGVNVIRGMVLVDVEKSLTDQEINDNYGFDHLQYTKVNQMMKPIIRFSPDGNMAFVAERTKYSFEEKDSLGNVIKKEFIIASLQVFEKRSNCWNSTAIAQTFADDK